ncbi:POTE ankyrin domain family member A-like [Phodopus roborovskii]|uniref:POTE ankyrin domain family member A-like n=1 Tax=Phodopus roborovskii TaxID=109678 RepID=UPI0021E45C97|nr:POTE ankyrin domain family member A-like [Phodopus roborovskii]
MQEDFDYDAYTYEAPKRARWYTRLLPACLRHGCLSNKRQAFPLYLIGYDPVGQLQRAASAGDVASVERFINVHGCHVNEYDRRDRTSLHYACAHNHPDVVRLLLSYRANINIPDDEGCTPLIKATQRDNVECVSILLTQGADPHVNDLSGNTALHHAVCRGNTTIVSKLLEYNVDIEGKTEYGLTPYKLALYENQHEMAEFLIQNGANIHSEVKSKRTTSPETKPVTGMMCFTLTLSSVIVILFKMPVSLSYSAQEYRCFAHQFIKTLKQTSPLDKMDRIKEKGQPTWKSEVNMGTKRETRPERPEKKTSLMVEKKKAEHFPKIADDHDIAVPQPTAHIVPTYSSGSGDSVEIVATKKQDLGAACDTARVLQLPLGDALDAIQDADIILDAENLADYTHCTIAGEDD